MSVHAKTQPSAPVQQDAFAETLPSRPGTRIFERGFGGKLAGLLAEVRFRVWRLKHPGASYGAFYAQTIARRLACGGAHKTLGARNSRAKPVEGLRPRIGLQHQRQRGRETFDWLRAHGLQSNSVCIDYGCGSLRTGQHLIGFLDPHCYWGLDLVDDFYRDGLTFLEPSLIAGKQPELAIIGPESLAAARAAAPSFIVSNAVMQHVPPAELESYLSVIVSLMGSKTLAAISFKCAGTLRRTGANTWTYPLEDVRKTLAAIDPQIVTQVDPLGQPGGDGIRRMMLCLRRIR